MPRVSSVRSKLKSADTAPVHPRVGVLDASTRLFSKHGYTGTTMRDIAQEVGILPGSLYAHIASKDDLLFEIVESGIDIFLAIASRKEVISGGAEQRMRAAIKAHVAVVAENPERTLVVFHQWRYLSGSQLKQAIEKRLRYQQIFDSILEYGVKEGVFAARVDRHIAIFTILGALNWTAEWYSPKGPLKADQIGEFVADVLLKGLVQSKR